MRSNENFYETVKFSRKNRKPIQGKQSANPNNFTHDYTVDQLLSDLGNHVVGKLLTGGIIQAKLNVSSPGDIFEQEADRIAKNIVTNQAAPAIQPKAHTLQTHSDTDGFSINNNLESKINNIKNSGQPLNRHIRDFFEPRFGIDLEHIRIHNDNNSNALAKAINAKAFTYGNDIVFGKGEYQPETMQGKELIAHELTHTIQQGAGIQRDVIQRKRDPLCPVRESVRIGNIDRLGVLEHVLIEQDYLLNINPSAEREVFIPQGSLSNNNGWVDLADHNTGEMFEIKHISCSFSALAEIAQYVAMATLHCRCNVPWHPGLYYPERVIPLTADTEVVAHLLSPGVIEYWTRKRQRAPQPKPFPVREFNKEQVLKKIREFVRKVVETGEDATEAARQFLEENQDVLQYIATVAAGALIIAAIVIVVATIIEDIVTFGAGLADDVPCFAAASALVKVAFEMLKAQPAY